MPTLTSQYQYIGRSNGVKAYGKDYYYYILLYAKTSGAVATGKHTVTVLMRLACANDATFYDWLTTGYVKVGGNTAFSWDSQKIPGSAWDSSSSIKENNVTYKRHIDLKTGSVEIDTKYASKEITIETSWIRDAISGTPPVWLPKNEAAKASIKVTLPAIASASSPTVSASSVTMGNNVTITTNRVNESLTHDLTYAFGGATGTIATGVAASYTWKVPDMVSKISGKNSGTCTITCVTKSGSTAIGTKTVTITLNVPAVSSPTVSASSLQMGKSITINTNRKSSGYTHKLTYKIGTKTDTIGTGITDSKAWIPPKSLAAFTQNNKSATCTITCQTYNGTLLIGSKTVDITLTVPDATVPVLSAASVILGEKIVIATTKEAEVYAHDLKYSLKADGNSTVVASGTIETGVNAGYTWEVPLSLAAKMPSATKGTITISCSTKFKDSTVEIGLKTASFIVTVPNNSTTQPKFEMTLAPDSELPDAFSDVYVAGKSGVNVSYSASSDHSTIKSYETKLLTYSGDTNPYISPAVGNSGTVKITGKVTDARGYSTTKTETITVIEYSRPRICPYDGNALITCTRCNSDKAIDPGGTYLLIQIGRRYSPVLSGDVQKNFCKLSYQWKTDAADDNEYSAPVELLARDATSDYVDVALPDIVTSNTTAYSIRLIAEDDVGEKDTVTVIIPTLFATFHVPANGHGFTLGGYHNPGKIDVFDCNFDAEFQGNVSGRVLGLGKVSDIPPDSDLNDYKTPGVYSVYYNNGRIKNSPDNREGTLRVWISDGGYDYAKYRIQEYIPSDNYCTYRRLLDNSSGVWEYGAWKVTGGCTAIVSEGIEQSSPVGYFGDSGDMRNFLWYWRKYSDGTAECWARVENGKRSIDNALGNMYCAKCDEVLFPFRFSSNPVVSATVESDTTLMIASWVGPGEFLTDITIGPADYRVLSPIKITSATFTIAYHAIGRWKE